MPFENEYASGDSLLHFQKSESWKEFEGVVASREDAGPSVALNTLNPYRRDWTPYRVIAIDGSNITHQVRNGFPGADAAIVMISIVLIDIAKLSSSSSDEIPSPRMFSEMDDARVIDTVLPGANVIRKSIRNDSPTKYFRNSLYQTLNGRIDSNFESLLETLRAITVQRAEPEIKCPLEDCAHDYVSAQGCYQCTCERQELLYETDELRIHQRFQENGSNGEVHGEVRHILEILALLNVLRYYACEQRVAMFRDCAFVLDGPLGIFGQPAWLLPYVKRELQRINAFVRRWTGEDIVVFGIEKGGQFVEHFNNLDWTDKDGPRSKYKTGTLLTPSIDYIHRNIVFRAPGQKPWGDITYYGRKVLYKTRSGEHAVINTAMLNDAASDVANVSEEAYPRIGDMLDIVDRLSTYLYKDGFMPLVRANAHAAVPLKRGINILEELFRNKPQ